MNIILLITVVVTAIVAIFATWKTLECNYLKSLDRAKDTQLKSALTRLEKEEDVTSELHKQVEKLTEKLNHAEADRVELRAEKLTAENKILEFNEQLDAVGRTADHWIEAAEKAQAKLSKFDRKRDPKTGKIVSSKPKVQGALDATRPYMTEAAKPPHGLAHGLTVKNPTEAEAKAIFAEAKRLGIDFHGEIPSINFPWIWYGFGNYIGVCGDIEGEDDTYVSYSEFIARMRNHVKAK